MIDVLNQLLDGVPTGCVYGLVAVGLVLTYKTSGVFNFAFGAQAFTSAVVFYVLVHDHGWPLVPSALIAVVVVSIALGTRARPVHLPLAADVAATGEARDDDRPHGRDPGDDQGDLRCATPGPGLRRWPSATA